MVGRDAASIAATASKMLLLVACAVDVVVNGFRLCHALSIYRMRDHLSQCGEGAGLIRVICMKASRD